MSLEPQVGQNLTLPEVFVILSHPFFSDYQGLDHWSETYLIENLLEVGLNKKSREISCLMEHFETGYYVDLWVPLMKYKDNTSEVEDKTFRLKKEILEKIKDIIFSVKNGIPLEGSCQFCP